MRTTAVFPAAPARAGMYESFYLRAVSPVEPIGIWIRHTVHKRPGRRATGSLWCTVFDAGRGAPFMHKSTSSELSVPDAAWIAIGGSEMGPERAFGVCGAARWSLRYASSEPELRHLSPRWLYRMPFPRTKLTSPAPAASFDGVLELAGRDPIELREWPGMVGHNWGSEHAERWIWLHGTGFTGAPGDWIDVALARVRFAGCMTPWIASGAMSLDGRRLRLGGLGARGPRVQETAQGCVLALAGRQGLAVDARVEVPDRAAAGWRYADPDGGEHDVVNCSVSSLQLDVHCGDAPARTLITSHAAAYELGMRERDHGVPIAAFGDG
ncbi:MAG TPA: hypothetical protein VGN08_02560 [Solirubrobacteraceae bacterium]|jgi:hypothetical protein